MKLFLLVAGCWITLLSTDPVVAQSKIDKSKMSFLVSCEQAASHYFHVEFQCAGIRKDSFDLKMPGWMPGYYQIMDYAKNLEGFSAEDQEGKSLKWIQVAKNSWRVYSKKTPFVKIIYNIKANTQFVATSYIGEERGYIAPCGVFLYVEGMLKHPASVTIRPLASWNRVATGLDSVKGTDHSFIAPDFDILFDSPILMGNLEELPPFYIKGIPHRFIGYHLGDFDRKVFMDDLKKIVEAGIAVIGDIPYKHYTFLAIGPGRGGIEHLNTCTISFEGGQMNNRESKVRTYSFIAHEYFHHFNVKRIRPIELGPFDYDKENRTRMLWVSEGLSVYYEYMVLSRAGLMNEEELFRAFQSNISAYENKPGHLFQSLAQSSYETWSDGPYGRTGDEVNKTISYYDKGPAVGLLLDFSIRNDTKNARSLDDIMRFLYYEYYKKKKRGFTEDEFRRACDSISGGDQAEIFEYVNTTKEPDYKKYLQYAGLDIDTMKTPVPGAYLGANVRDRNDSLFITSVEWNSPAWLAGLRGKDQVISMNGKKIDAKEWRGMLAATKTGDTVKIAALSANGTRKFDVALGARSERSFKISRIVHAAPFQTGILLSWLNGK